MQTLSKLKQYSPNTISKCIIFSVPLSSFKFWNDSLISLDDMERFDGCNR